MMIVVGTESLWWRLYSMVRTGFFFVAMLNFSTSYIAFTLIHQPHGRYTAVRPSLFIGL